MKALEETDRELLRLFEKRLSLWQPGCDEPQSRKLAEIKRAGSDLDVVFFSGLYELCRSGHSENYTSETVQRIEKALQSTEKLFPACAAVACQGVEGAYSQHAAEKLFSIPDIFYFKSFESVFSAVDKGLCQYGVLPLENSSAGSVNAIYDLMMKYNFSIVRSVRLKVDHCLLAKKGTSVSEIKEIYSHEQALGQCAAYLKKLGGVKISPCENTAAAARLVAESDRTDIAALASGSCAAKYGLNILEESVQDYGGNFTRFICISKNTEIYPGSSRTSVMLTIPHRPGSLYRVMARINALGINLTKLESRPIPDRDFEFMFYFDLDVPVYSPKLSQLISELESECESFRYLGSYSEMI